MIEPPARILPEIGIDVPADVHQNLSTRVDDLRTRITSLRETTSDHTHDLLTDVEIFALAVDAALKQRLFYAETDFEIASFLLLEGARRADQLGDGCSPWTDESLTVRGYRSKVDGSVQPYGLVIPETYDLTEDRTHRLDIWHHGRSLKNLEFRFLHDRLTNAGRFTPEDAFVLHTFGRYSNAMKYAGETDTFEALDHVKARYPIDEDRISVRGFSMGGAATWHQATHQPDIWVAATPGAGFAESAIYQNVFSTEPHPSQWEQILWRLYDATEYAGNLHHCPALAYSGEEDHQKQAADIMIEAAEKEGIEIPHIVGARTGHNYDDASKEKIETWLSDVVAAGRERTPKRVRFTTFTLRYNRMAWVRIQGLGAHWERAVVDAEISDGTIRAETRNITALTFDTTDIDIRVLQLDGQEVNLPGRRTRVHLERTDGRWHCVDAVDTSLRKRHGVQGPIDDVWFDSFTMVTPSQQPLLCQGINDWIDAEFEDATYQWRMQYRGCPRVTLDDKVTEDDLRDRSLVLWGDPRSNTILARISEHLPIRWDADDIIVGQERYDAGSHVPVFIWPNPLNPSRYVVLNTGMTFSRFGAHSNALQTPKLPDWAVLDVSVPRSERHPAGVVDAGFFDERWRLRDRQR